MIKLIETATFKDGRESTTDSKEFKSWSDFRRKITRSALSTELTYNLLKHREAFIDYEDGRIHLKVVETNPEIKIITTTTETETSSGTAGDTQRIILPD